MHADAVTHIAPSASRRLRVFSASLWVVGAVVIGAVATASVVSFFSYRQGSPADRPWQQTAPLIATQDGSTWSASGSAMIPLPDDLTTGEPLLVSYASSEDEVVFVYQSPTATVSATETPQYLALLDDTLEVDTATFASPGSVLWVQTNGPWAITIDPLDAENIGAGTSGAGTRYLSYTGSQTTAEFRHEGDGVVTVEVLTPTTREAPIIELGPLREGLAWTASAEVVFHVIAEHGALWTLSLEGEATP